MEAVGELRGFQPVAQQMQLQGGEAKGGMSGEGQLPRTGLRSQRGAGAQQGLDAFQTLAGTSGSLQLGLMKNEPEQVENELVVFNPQTGLFRLIIDQGWVVMNGAPEAGGRRIGTALRERNQATQNIIMLMNLDGQERG